MSKFFEKAVESYVKSSNGQQLTPEEMSIAHKGFHDGAGYASDTTGFSYPDKCTNKPLYEFMFSLGKKANLHHDNYARFVELYA
jgi:hypothetical protein